MVEVVKQVYALLIHFSGSVMLGWSNNFIQIDEAESVPEITPTEICVADYTR